MQSGHEPCIMELIKKTRNRRSPLGEEYRRSPWFITIATALRFWSSRGVWVLSYCRTQRLSFSLTACIQQIPLATEEAAISLGASKIKTFFKITVPMMSNGIISGAILSWETIITELSSAIILYSSRTVTLTLAIYTFVTRGNYGYAAALATILTILTTISLLIFMKISKSKEITFW